VHLVVTRSAERTLAHEVGPHALDAISRLAARRHPIEDVGASIASGSFRTAGMIVAPCSIRTLSAIAASARTICWCGRRTCSSRSGGGWC